MAQYDGSIRINTKIDTKNAEIQLSTLENNISNTAKKVASLRSKFDSLKNVKIPTPELIEAQKDIEKYGKLLEDAREKLKKLQEVGSGKKNKDLIEAQIEVEKLTKKIEEAKKKEEEGISIGSPSKIREAQSEIKKYTASLEVARLNAEKLQSIENESISAKINSARYDVEQYQDKILDLEETVKKLKSEGKDFTFGDPAEIEKVGQQLLYEEERLSSMSQKRDLLNAKIQAQAEEEQRLADIKENATVADQELVDLLERRRRLLEQIKDLEKAGVTEGYQEYDTAFAELADVQNQINSIREMRDAAAEARESYVSLGETIRTTFRTMARGLVDIPISAMKTAVNGIVSGFQKLGTVARNVAVKSFRLLGTSIKSALSKAGSMIGNIVSKLKTLGSTARKSFGDMNRSAKRAGGTMGTIASRFKGIALSFLLFNQITKALNGSVKAIKEGFGNLYKDNERFQNSVNELKASILTLKNAFAAAFRPLVDLAIPYIQMAADKLTDLLNKVGQFTAAITGQKTYTKAIKQTADAFKEVKKAAESYLSPLDEINRYSDGKGNGDEADQFGLMFEELPIEQKFSDMAKKVKDVLKDLFSPIKEVWNREGEFVIDSWKYGLEEIGKLLKDVGRDFLEVWKQPATIAMLQDILHIFGDIGLIVGNLAAKFREAWNENNVGLHILENIRDIFAVIVHNIREAADYTVEWTKTLDFTPLLQGIERLTASLVPFFDFLSGTLADFYTEFLLPLASWTLSEQGISRLLNVLADFMESVDWQGLRTALKELYGALEPYAEKIGTGLIDFIERMKEYGVEFLNFLPEHIQKAADSLRNGDLPGAFEEFGTISGKAVITAFNFIRDSINNIPWGEIGKWIASFINGINWQEVGDAVFGSFTAIINSAIDLIYNFITTTDWRNLGEALGKSLSDAFISIDWVNAGRTVGEAFKGFFNFLAETIENIDWFQLGERVRAGLASIDWDGIFDSFCEFVGAAFGGIGAFFWGLLGDNLFEGPGIQYFVDKIHEAGGNVVEGLKNGIIDGFSNIWNWIKEHMVDPFLNGFKSAFGIHSPSTVMFEMGTYLIQGLLNGINSLVQNVTAIWQSMKETAVSIWNSVKESLSRIWETIKAAASSTWNSIKTTLSGIWNSIKTTSSSTWNSIKSTLSSTWDSMKTKATSTFDGIKTKLQSVWNSVKSTTVSVWNSISSKISSVIDSIKGKIEGFVSKIRDAISSVKDFLSSGFDKVKSAVSGGSSGSTYSVQSYSMRSMPAPYAANPAFAVLNSAPIPKLATGAVIPANREFLAVLGDQKHGTNVEAPLDTIRQAQKESLIETLAELGMIGGFGNNSGGNTYNVKAIANNRVLFEIIIQEGIKQLMSTGRNPFDLVTT